MDQDHGLERLLGEGNTSRGRCGSCTTVQQIANRATSDVTGTFDEDFVVITGPEVDGMVVVPRRHIHGLDQLPALRRAHVLAALQRAARSVREGNPRSASRIVALADLPSSEGHVCFHVQPCAPDDAADPSSRSI